MRASIWVLLLVVALVSPAWAQMGSAHGFDSGMGEGGYMGMSWHSRTDPGPAFRGFSWSLPYRPFWPASRYYWDPYGAGYLTNQWTKTSTGAVYQLWYDPLRHVYYYYP